MVTLNKLYEKLIRDRRSLEKPLEANRAIVKSVLDAAKLAESTLGDTLERVKEMSERNIVQQFVDQQEREVETLRKLRENESGTMSWYTSHADELVARREKEEQEKQEDRELQRKQLQATYRQNWLTCIALLVAVAGILVALLLSESFRSWLFGWFM